MAPVSLVFRFGSVERDILLALPISQCKLSTMTKMMTKKISKCRDNYRDKYKNEYKDNHQDNDTENYKDSCKIMTRQL